MKKLIHVILLLFIAIAQPSLAAVEISVSWLCWTLPDIVMVKLTDASGNPKPYTGVRFSVLSGNPAEFIYPVTYTDEQGRAVSVLALIGWPPSSNQVQIQAEDFSTGETASRTVPIYTSAVCESYSYTIQPITAIAGNPYIATGTAFGFGLFSGWFTTYSTDPRVAVVTRGDEYTPGGGGSYVSLGTVTLEINPRQAGQAYLLADSYGSLVSGYALNAPITVLAPDVNAPVITSQPKTTTDIYRPYLYQVIASSPLGKTLTYNLTAGPAGMQINAQTGLLDWTPVLENVGQHVIKLTVSDGTLSTYQHFRLQVSSTQTGLYVGPVAVSGESGTVISWTPFVMTLFSPIVPTCAIAAAPGNGTATVAADCSSGTYQSNPGFIGTDSFFYNATICPTPTGPCYVDSDTVTVAVTEPLPTDPCLAQYPVSQFSQTGKEGTLTISITGNITAHANKVVKVCPGTTLKYQTSSTKGPVVCKVKNNTTRGSGSLKINDHLKCTDKPAGKDKVNFKVKSGVSQ
jgi:hypothetical protein